MRISNLSILFVVIVAFVMGCAGKRNREPATTYWNDACSCRGVCEYCANDVTGQIVESNSIEHSSSFGKNCGTQESAGSLNCLNCNRKTDVLMDGKCNDCLKQIVGQKVLGIRDNNNRHSGVEVDGAFNELNETSETGFASTTRRSLSPDESAGPENFEVPREPDSDAFRSPQRFLTPEKVLPDQTDWNRDQSSPLPTVDPNFAHDVSTELQGITGQELQPVKPLPMNSRDREVVDKLPFKSEAKEADDAADWQLEKRHGSISENRTPLKTKGLATETGRQDAMATDGSLASEPDPKSESFRLQDLFPNTMPNVTIWTIPDAKPATEQGALQTDNDIDWGLPKIVYPNGNQSQGNDGGSDSLGGSSGRNQGQGAPPLNPPDSWQGNSSSSELQFSNRSEQEIIRELRRSSLATSNGFENTAIISETTPGLHAVLLTAKPVPHYHQLLAIEQKRNLAANGQLRSDSNNRPIGSTPNRIPAQNVSNRRNISVEEEFDFRPIPELTQPAELSLAPVEAEKFLEEIIETFSFPPLPPIPPARVPDAVDKKDGQWFSSDSSLLTGSGLKESDSNENRMTDLPGNAGGSKAHFRFKQPSFQSERSQ